MKTLFFAILLCSLPGGSALLLADDQTKPPAETSKKSEGKGTLSKLELHVSGMSCHNCSDAVEDALAAVDGVEVESVDAKSNLAVVKYDPAKVDRAKMVAAVKATKKYVVEPTVDYSELEYQSDGSFSRGGKPFTGTATGTHGKSGKISQSYQFKEGKLHGLVREWYETGQMSGKKFYNYYYYYY